MHLSPLIEALIEALRILPGVGPKSAQRMALNLLERNRDGARRLAEALVAAADRVGECRRCRALSEESECAICRDPRRDDRVLCIVESPADVLAIEQTAGYRGRYFVLHGRLSPIDGIGPAELGLEALVTRVRDDGIEEVILATNPTVEGEATAHYISEMLEGSTARLSRIAHGVPLGGELEYIDGGTIAHAFAGRRQIS